MNKKVSFPIAKLLKEKGIDDESAHYYNEKGELLFDVDFPSLQPTKPHIYYSAPTIADVVMWFYDKHRIWIWVGCRELEDGTNKTIFIPQGRTIPSTKKDGFVVDIIPYTPKGSPTEAYEAGIEHILNNLI